jgi:hypothetical protein
MMTTKFNMSRDINGYNGFGLTFTDTAYSATLASSTNTTLTVPSAIGIGKQGYGTVAQTLAVFNFDPGTSVWVADNTTAAAPAGASFAATASELNPAARLVNGGDILNFFTTGTGVNVSVCFYSVS